MREAEIEWRSTHRELKFGTGNVFDRLDDIVLQVQTETQVTILADFLAVTVLRAVNNLVACHFVQGTSNSRIKNVHRCW